MSGKLILVLSSKAVFLYGEILRISVNNIIAQEYEYRNFNHSSPPKHSELPNREFLFLDAIFSLRVSSFGHAPF